MPERLLTLNQVEDQTGFRKSKIYEMISQERFPVPIRFGRAVRWLESEVQLWISNHVKAHRNLESCPITGSGSKQVIER